MLYVFEQGLAGEAHQCHYALCLQLDFKEHFPIKSYNGLTKGKLHE